MSSNGRYLLDTNVVSETRKRRPDENVLKFLAEIEGESLYLSVLTLGELQKGAAAKRKTDPLGAERLARWVDGLQASFAARILGVDPAVARLWGDISGDRSRPVVDTLLAATAMRHDLVLVTRNLADFAGIPLGVVNPWIFDDSVSTN